MMRSSMHFTISASTSIHLRTLLRYNVLFKETLLAALVMACALDLRIVKHLLNWSSGPSRCITMVLSRIQGYLKSLILSLS